MSAWPTLTMSSLPYGMRTSSVGAFPSTGCHTLAARATPSRIGTRTSISYRCCIGAPRRAAAALPGCGYVKRYVRTLSITDEDADLSVLPLYGFPGLASAADHPVMGAA